jgi:hypothetical protein
MRPRYSILVIAGLAAVVALPAMAQIQVKPSTMNGIRSQLNQASAPASQAAPAAPAVQNAAPRGPAAQAAPKAGTPAVPAASGPRRDPFDPLLNRGNGSSGPAPDLPPGKAGLMVGTLRLDGLVRGPNGMLAVVTNPQQRVYFLREGDRIFDGTVTRITLEAVSFQQTGRDAFGNSQQHEVTRRLYPTPGEQR